MNSGIRFQRLGGSCQLVLESANDLYYVPELNDAHWAMTSVRTDSLLCDPEFLAFMDSDANGRIRVDEVKDALRWLLTVLSDPAGVAAGSDVLSMDSINEHCPDGIEIRKTVQVALANLGLPDSKTITLAQIRNQSKIIADALQNGDGVIPPGPVGNPAVAECIRGIMDKIGKQVDRSGAEGIGSAELDQFEAQSNARLAWLDEGEARKTELFPYGEKTPAVYDALAPLREKLDDFFKSCEAYSLTEETDDVRLDVQNKLDPMDAASVDAFLAKSPIAPVNPKCVLALSKMRHPLWRKKILDFFSMLPGSSGSEISIEFYRAVKEKLIEYGDWLARKPETKIDSWDPEDLRNLRKESIVSCIRGLIERDKAVKTNLDNCSSVQKLILYQKNMMEFLNNFVTLDRLFDNETPSMIQAGRLVMDGRLFTLCTVVYDAAEHKKIAENSNICVMYLNATTGLGKDAKSMKLAVAVTSGHMRHLFIGKSGIFFTGDGSVWDAKVFDFIQQPVSITEAVKMPFYKFADFLQKQADKFFSARSKQYEDTLSKDIQSNAALPVGQKPGTPPAPAAPTQTPAFSGSMVLMGGGVGIAAIGSAFAFMAKSIQGLSVHSVLAVFFGILLIFGGPIITISLAKLFRRNLSVFLEANGYALNGQMRLSLRMGRFFTFTPPIPIRSFIFSGEFFHIPESKEDTDSTMRKKYVLYFLLAVMLLECIALIWLHFGSLLEYWRKFF